MHIHVTPKKLKLRADCTCIHIVQQIIAQSCWHFMHKFVRQKQLQSHCVINITT